MTRVTTLGELAASIAHEVNQPLAAIVADASACLRWLAADRPDLDSVREALAAVVKDGERAGGGDRPDSRAALIARRSTREPCDLADVVHDVLPLAGPELRRRGIVLQTALAPDLPRVIGDRIQLQQVLLNLLVNAGEAMRETNRSGAASSCAPVRSAVTGAWAILAVQDAGVGFRELDEARLFEAFYTTKPGRPRHGAVHQPLDRRAARGTTVGHVECRPRRHLPPRPAGDAVNPDEPIVFIVDDDQDVRDSLRRLLTSVGLAVEVFDTAQAFLTARRADAPSCLVLDVRLPG